MSCHQQIDKNVLLKAMDQDSLQSFSLLELINENKKSLFDKIEE